MIENTRAGLEAARARGKKGGRRRVMDEKKAIALALRADPKRPSQKSARRSTFRASFYRYTGKSDPESDQQQK